MAIRDMNPLKGLNLSKPIMPEGGILALAADLTIGAVDGAMSKLGNAIDDFKLPSLSGSIAMVGNTVETALGAFRREELSAPAVSVAKEAPAVEVAQAATPVMKTNARANGVVDVDPAEIGTFAAPSFSVASANIGQSTGRG